MTFYYHIPHENRSFRFGSVETVQVVLPTLAKTPAEKLDIVFDWSEMLDEGQVIYTGAFDISPALGGVTEFGGLLLSSNSSDENSSTVVVIGGNVGHSYVVTCTISKVEENTTSILATFTRSILIVIVARK